MTDTLRWNGSAEDWVRLTKAVERHCSCDPDVPRPIVRCGAHSLLQTQEWLDAMAMLGAAREVYLKWEQIA